MYTQGSNREAGKEAVTVLCVSIKVKIKPCHIIFISVKCIPTRILYHYLSFTNQ